MPDIEDIDLATVDWKATAENLQRRVNELEAAALVEINRRNALSKVEQRARTVAEGEVLSFPSSDTGDLAADVARYILGEDAAPSQNKDKPGQTLTQFVEWFRTDLVYKAPEEWPSRISWFLDTLVTRYGGS